MSYILDAMRKADSERERGAVPGLHTQPVPTASVETHPARRGVPVAWVASGAAVLVAGALAWTWSGRGSETPLPRLAAEAPAVAPAPPATPPIVAPAPPPVVAPAPAMVSPAPAVQTTPAVQPAPLAVTPRAATPPPPAPARHVAKPAAPVAPAVAKDTAPAAHAAASAPAEAKVYAVNELPADVRRDWPQLTIGGSIYSETPASRFLIINGQIYHEGDKVANGLSLEQIKLKAAVLLYRGYRVGITY